ncbi:histidine phosphatase family protein [archaeon]|jgi:2,3-bisphosphoglycerate-dependent phosphoglycerate mutase|nr:histidine phosphatase family protein [archaeon]MBT6824155.1 histidine phosphatase family protein [archaeon]MBT7107001.1 histidine phosphatase family protein [archaeon]MBT7297613.1 histidine phosphatase family protein [archaeon]
MKKSIYLFRHGQTFYNRDKIFTGWKDSKLTPLGCKQARMVAKQLKGKEIDVAYHTRLSRSKNTLKEVLKFHPECNVVLVDDRMIERNYGVVQGISHKKYISENGIEKFDFYHRDYRSKYPKGESIEMVEKRVNSFVKDIIKMIKKDKVNVAVSAHGNSMRPFRKYFEKLSVKEMMSLENPYDEFFEYEIKC